MRLANTMITAHRPLFPPRTARSSRRRSTTAAMSRPSWSRITGISSAITCGSMLGRFIRGAPSTSRATIPGVDGRARGVAGRADAAARLDRPGSRPVRRDPVTSRRSTDDRRPRALGADPRRARRAWARRRRSRSPTAGYQICGIHLDFRAALAHVEEVKAAIEAAGVRGAVHQHERRRRREARRRRSRRCASGSTRRAAAGRDAVRPGRHALARVRLARPVPHRGPEGAASIARRWR